MPGHEIRTAFITGASSGIGAALAQIMARAGIQVALAARRAHELEALAERIAADGGSARVHAVDVGDPAAITAAVLQADDACGGLDVVVANAGVATQRWSGKIDWHDCATMLDVNVVGATATLVAPIARMVERGRGHLVGVSSLAAYRGLPKLAVYSASKAYLSALCESLRVDLASTGIAVTEVRPGYVRTAMNAGAGKLPLELTAEAAAQEIFDAIVARKAVHAFPLAMAAAMRSVTSLPNALWDRIASKMT